MPEPMPVVMYQVILVITAGRRSLPELEIQCRGNRDLFAVTDGLTIIGIPRLCKIRLADDAVTYLLNSFDKRGHGATLITHLNMTTMFTHGFCQQLSFVRILTTWFFYVYK